MGLSLTEHLYLQQGLLLLADVFFLQHAVAPQQGLQGRGLPRRDLAFGSQFGF